MLLNAYNKCLFEGHVSQKWKIARLVLIRKGDKSLDKLSSYRPICLLDSLGKLFEKIIDNRIQATLEDNHRLTECQHGFQKKRSTINALEYLKKVVENSGKWQRNGILTLDIKNEFNSAPWSEICKALKGESSSLHLQTR